jgi:type III restriction enzyme
MEHCQWSLLDHTPRLMTGAFDLKQTANTFEIDIDGRHVTVTPGSQTDQQLMLDVDVEGWTEQGLVLFLARQVREADLSPNELLAWLTQAVSFLTTERHLPLASLMQCKYVLARKLKERVADIRRDERGKVYQDCLFGPEARPEVSYERGFEFKEGTSPRRASSSIAAGPLPGTSPALTMSRRLTATTMGRRSPVPVRSTACQR